jgi:hypothetical protein
MSKRRVEALGGFLLARAALDPNDAAA